MHKLLISFLVLSAITGCSNINIDKDRWDLFGNVIPRSLEKLPFVYRPPIIQGNLISQDNVNRLYPGMSKQDVQAAMGTALLQDVFHDNRWDYYYGMGIGRIELEKRLTLYFEDNKLVKIVGDYQPLPELKGEGKPPSPDTIISVPDWTPPTKTLVESLMGSVGLGDDSTARQLQNGKASAEAEQLEEELDSTTRE